MITLYAVYVADINYTSYYLANEDYNIDARGCMVVDDLNCEKRFKTHITVFNGERRAVTLNNVPDRVKNHLTNLEYIQLKANSANSEENYDNRI